jgi:hypothetical protein
MRRLPQRRSHAVPCQMAVWSSHHTPQAQHVASQCTTLPRGVNAAQTRRPHACPARWMEGRLPHSVVRAGRGPAPRSRRRPTALERDPVPHVATRYQPVATHHTTQCNGTTTRCNAVQRHHHALQRSATHNHALQRSATAPPHVAAQCNAPPHVAAQCNVLQRGTPQRTSRAGFLTGRGSGREPRRRTGRTWPRGRGCRARLRRNTHGCRMRIDGNQCTTGEGLRGSGGAGNQGFTV